MTKIINYSFRWPVKQIGPQKIEVQIPIGDGPQVLDQRFVVAQKLSDKECDEAEYAVLQTIAIVR